MTHSAQDNLARITAVTRRDVFDVLRAAEGDWWGPLDEVAFLGRSAETAHAAETQRR